MDASDMRGLIDCPFGTSDGVVETRAESGKQFKDMYATARGIADFALLLKAHRRQTFCTIPFCHTVEAEAMGADIVLGDKDAGTRAGEAVCTSLEQVLDVVMPPEPEGRMARMLEACCLLADEGEQVVFTLSGPVSVISCLADAGMFFKAWRKDRDVAMRVVNHIGDQLVPFVRHIAYAGATAISYADPPCAPGIVGPRCATDIAKEFTVPFIGRLCEEVPESTTILVCPLALPFAEVRAQKGRAKVRCSKGNVPLRR